MYDTMVNILLFIILFFLYLHITDQYKISEDLEIYEMDYSDPVHLQEVCGIRQPVLFQFSNVCPSLFENLNNITLSEKGGSKTPPLCVKDANDYWVMDNVDGIPLSLGNFKTLIATDSKSHYYTDNNEFLVEESFVKKEAEKMDNYLKPDYIFHKKYDVLMGSSGCGTPLQYHNKYRRYISVMSGKVRVKMAPWKSVKYLHPVKDYMNYEFFSKINVWSPQPTYKNDFDRVKFIEFDVHSGYVLYIPPYWWYSIQFETYDTLLLSATYDSLMSITSNSLHLLKYMIQQHNTKEKVTRTLYVDVESSPSSTGVSPIESNESTAEEHTQPPPPSQNEIHEPLE